MGQGQRTQPNNIRYQFSAACRLNLFFNDFIRKASVFYFVMHFPEGTLDLAGLFAIPIRLGGGVCVGGGGRRQQNNGNFTCYLVF